MNTFRAVLLCIVLAAGLFQGRSFAQVWPHMDSLIDNYTLPDLFVRLGKTNPVWGVEANGFQLGIQTSKDAYGTNEPIHALVTLTNISALRGWSRNEYERGGMTSLELVLLNGRELVKSRYLCDRTPGAAGRSSGSVNSVKPGKTAHDGIRVDVQFVLEPNRLYHLYAFRKAFAGDTEFVVTSGNVTFTITNGLPMGGISPALTGADQATLPTSPATTPSTRTATSKPNRASPFAASASPSSGPPKGANGTLPASSAGNHSPHSLATHASSVGFGGWLLIGLPLLVILWVLKRASKRSHKANH